MQRTTYRLMSIQEFRDAHSTTSPLRTTPHFLSQVQAVGTQYGFLHPDNGCRWVPLFVRVKLHQKSPSFSEKDCNDALGTILAPTIESFAK